MTDRDDATEADADADATGATKRERHVSERMARRKDDEVSHLERGTLVGRYVVLEVLGEGGMGVVYGAFDPELDRKVAIKLLQAKTGGSESAGTQAWLLREAQALARLAHPNVVGVHDVGTLPGDRVFVAMELVDGITLRKWLKAEPRTWREALPVLIAAGTGLAAAHKAGLVHRDFKPDNVLVGKDGRVRVMDFGLARLKPTSDASPASRASDLNIETKSPLHDSLTMVGSVLGTPAYMAPEIYAGEGADAGSDQFAFGVTLFEALFHSRPFTKEQLTPPRASPPKPKIPDNTRVPARIQRAVSRAISIDPAQRFPSIDALLAELAIDPHATRKRVVIAGVVIAAAAAAFTVSFAMRSHAPTPCQGTDQRMAGVWDTPIKQKVKDGFIATKRPMAAQAFGQLEKALDGYAADWVKTSADSCRATRVRKDQTEEVLTLRQTCLDRRLEELRALSTLLVEPAPELVDKGEKIASELDPLASCSNVAVLRAPGQPPPHLLAKVEAVGKVVAEAKAQVIAGKYFPALIASQKGLDGAKAIEWEPFVAEALLVRGAAFAATANPQDAATAFIEATWAALRARRDDVAAQAALSTAMLVADGMGKPSEAKIWLGLGAAFAKRAGLERSLEQRLYTVEGLVAAHSGDNKAAVAAHEKAFASAIKTHGPESPALWSDEVMLATTLTKALAYEKAIVHFEHAIMLREKVVGTDHLDIALILSNLGISYRHVGQGKKARAAFERTIAMREKMFGKNNPMLVPPLVNFSDYLNSDGDSAAALGHIQRAVKLCHVMPGIEHPMCHETDTTLAEVLGKLGRVAEARKLFDDLMVIETRVKSSVLTTTQRARAELELAQKAYLEAIAWAEKAIAGFEAAGGAENPELWRPLMGLGQAKLARGDKAGAKPVLERALAIGVKAGTGDFELRELRELLAKVQ